MTMFSKRWGTVVALGVVLLWTTAAVAQVKRGRQAQPGKRAARELNLTREQAAQLRPILQEEKQQLQALRGDTTLSKEQRRAKAQEIHSAATAKVAGILTAEQQAKWQQMRQNRQAKTPRGRKF
jgi:Spy/CpxP family protein refolding chaperone